METTEYEKEIAFSRKKMRPALKKKKKLILVIQIRLTEIILAGQNWQKKFTL